MPIVINWVDSCDGVEEIEKLQTPAGILSVHRRGDVIAQADWELTADHNPLLSNEQQLKEFWPNSDNFITLKLLKQGTPFRNKVWAELVKIPFGQTVTYSGLAKAIGSAARAVGNACRDNPFTLIIPCHRVVSVNGMGGYSGQTHGEWMAIKTKLLDYEAEHATCKTSH
ncbi:methylated-DNA--[protein]-cysteine S-methyltransferase [Methyloglobulus sp.]|uniref:methylated-DNA--[protein]-cysteine S-methyltransferase n=1 Tax=Methyloglobulus sp. TaxID=2518622 RepID=UPI0039893D80